MPEPTCRTCYAQTLSEGERTRFFAEDVTGCIYYCPEHQKAQDDMARHKSHGDVWPWVKTDDTELRDEDGDRRNRAWACVAYAEDRSDADLLIQSDAVAMVWDGDWNLRPVPPKEA